MQTHQNDRIFTWINQQQVNNTEDKEPKLKEYTPYLSPTNSSPSRVIPPPRNPSIETIKIVKNQNLVTNLDHANINIYVAPILQIEGVSNKWLHSITIFSNIITGVGVSVMSCPVSGVRATMINIHFSKNEKFTVINYFQVAASNINKHWNLKQKQHKVNGNFHFSLYNLLRLPKHWKQWRYLCSASIEAIVNKFLNDSCEVEQRKCRTNWATNRFR